MAEPHTQQLPAPPPAFPLRLQDARLLLQSDYQEIETGYAHTSDGHLHVAATTYMPNCTAAMISWWFGWIRNTEQYKLWHPIDHVFSTWDGPSGEYIGGTHLVHEYIGGHFSKLRINFRDPAEYFGDGRAKEFGEKGYGVAICGRVGEWDEEGEKNGTAVKDEGSGFGGHLIHLIKEEKIGVRMRSRFWLGDVPGASTEERKKATPSAMGEGLMKHCVEEMSILASVLPGLYEKHSGKK